MISISASGLLAVTLARLMGAEIFGQYSILVSILAIVILPIQGGLSPLVVRESARSTISGKADGVVNLLIWARRWLSWAVIVLVTLCSLAFCFYLERHEYSLDLLLGVGALVISVPFLAASELRSALIRGLGKPVLGLLPEHVLRPLIQVTLFVGVWLLFEFKSLVTASTTFFAAVVVGYFVGTYLLAKIKPGLFGEIPRGVVVSGQGRFFAVISLMMIAAAQIANSQLAILLLGATHGAVEAGHLKISASLAGLVLLGMQAINKIISPTLARLHSQGDMVGLQSVLTKCAIFSTMVSLPFLLVSALLGDFVLAVLVGNEYRSAHYLLAILALGQVVSAFFGPAGLVLTMTGHEKEYLKSIGASSLFGITLCIVFIPTHGAIGAAVALAVSTAVANVLFWHRARKVLGVDPSPLGVLSAKRHAVAKEAE